MNLKSLHPEGGIKIHKRTNEIEAFECGKVAFSPSLFEIGEALRGKCKFRASKHRGG